MGDLQPKIYDYLIGQTEPKTADEIADELGLSRTQAGNACGNLKRRGVLRIAGSKANENGRGTVATWEIIPGAPFETRASGSSSPRRSSKPRKLSTHPGVLRLRAAMDELMEAFIAVEANIVSDTDLRALEQMRAVAKHMLPSDVES